MTNQRNVKNLAESAYEIGNRALKNRLPSSRQVSFAGHRSQVIDKVGRKNLNLVIQCCKNTVAVPFLRISCRISSKFVLYWYLFTLGNKRRDVVTKAVSFI